MYQLLLIVAIVLLIIAIRRINRQPAKDRPKLILRYGLYIVGALSIILVLTGRLHWIAGAITALFPIAQRLIPIALRLLPFIKKPPQTSSTPPPSHTVSDMSPQQACEILGLKPAASEADIIQRHRELIQKNHPDRGGSDFLAAQINQAKDTLLKQKNN